jgi:hypothetical protein
MGELSRGETDKLPEYSQEHIRLTGDIDFQNFPRRIRTWRLWARHV